MSNPEKVSVTPRVRALARDLGVDLSTVVGTGVAGRIRAQDVLTAERDTNEQLYRSLFPEG